MDRNVKYLIIGAGISGLSFANYCEGEIISSLRKKMKSADTAVQ